MKEKFRKFLPVVVDMETGGFDPVNDALLEIAITLIDYDKEFRVGTTHRHHIIPFEGLNVSEESLEFTGIDLNHPLRNAVDEKEALKDLFSIINKHKNKYECSRAILVGHNAHFDLGKGKEKYGLESNLKASLLSGKKIGLLGFGDLAKSLYPLLLPFTKDINVYDPWLSKNKIKSLGFNPIS